jgi:acetyl esterase/lipase
LPPVSGRSLTRRDALGVLGGAVLLGLTGDEALAASRRPRKALVVAKRIVPDVVYGTGGGEPLKLDLYYPTAKSSAPRPLLIQLYGGSFRTGDKKAVANTPELNEMLARGYAVACPNYRLAPAHRFPAAVEDVKCAVRFLRANAARFDVDAFRIGAWGYSAGGNLASLLGLTASDAGLEGDGGYPGVSSRVSAVADLFGPVDFTLPGARAGYASYVPERKVREASPVSYSSGDDAAFLLVHGDKDSVVPLSQSIEFHKKLVAAHLPAKLVVVRNGEHNLRLATAGVAMQPTRTEIARLVGGFFDRWLRRD